MRNHRTITVLSITLLLDITFLAMRPVAAQSSVLVQSLWGGSYADYANAVTTDRAGNIYVAGGTTSYGPGSPTCASLSILKYSPLGNLLWQRLWSNGSFAYATGIALDGSGNIYITGVLYTTCNGHSDGLLLKLDPGGNLLWQKIISQSPDSNFNALAVDASGNVFVTGYYGNGEGIYSYSDVLIMRFNSTGSLVWQRSWGGALSDNGVGVALDRSDNIYISGQTANFAAPGLKLVVLKLDPSGNLQFQKLVGNGTEYGQSVGLDSTGNIYATATSTGGNSPKILVVKFDSTGGPLWQKTWDGNRTDGSNGLAIDSSGNLDIVGSTNSYGAGGTCGSTVCSDILLLKLDGSGNIISQLVYGSPNVNDQANAVADLFGTMVVVGTVNSAPPYQTSSGNNTLAISSFSIQSQGNSTLGTPAATIVSPNGGSLLTPSGGRTYSGGSDQIILRFGDLPRLSFATSPGTGGTITVNGTTYSNGQTGSFPIGNATLTAVAPSGYAFTSWNSTGGISVSSPTASTTQVSVTGSGTLTAQFQQTSSTADYALYYISAGAAAAAAISIIGVVMYRRRKRPSGPG